MATNPDPSTFTSPITGLTIDQQKALDKAKADAAAAAKEQQTNQSSLAKMLQDQAFASAYYQTRALASNYDALSNPNTNPTATAWQRLVYATLSQKLNAVVTALQQMPN